MALKLVGDEGSVVTGTTEVMAAAIRYARGGRPVFPCNMAKRPLTDNGFQDATTDAAQVAAWWGMWPNALIGMPTGAVSDTTVIDVDQDESRGIDGTESLYQLEQQHGKLPDTVETITPRGGRHLMFAYEPGVRNSAGRLGVGLDVRGEGGYVILPPSEGSGGRYEWEASNPKTFARMPPWVSALLRAPVPPPVTGDNGGRVCEGARNAHLASLAGSMRRRGMSETALAAALAAENLERCSPPLSDGEVRTIAHSVGRYAPEPVWAGGEPEARPEGGPPAAGDLDITEDELARARLSPRCIVQDHTYADVAQLVAPGGTGKTTLLLYESICIALGVPMWGLEVYEPGWTLLVTAEDRREQIVARLREIMVAHDLRDRDRDVVMRSIRVWDVAGKTLKLASVAAGMVTLTTLADGIIEAYRDNPPALVVFDPLVSFGASEAMVNDNEQELVTAARRIVRGLDCCVRYVHHTGKGNARQQTLDQYSGRGGSALADGSRMTSILATWMPSDEGLLVPPRALFHEPGSSIVVYVRAKLSYAAPGQPRIWIKRTGFMFEHYIEQETTQAREREDSVERVYEFIVAELQSGRYHTSRTLEDHVEVIGVSRSALRYAISALEVGERIIQEPLPAGKRRGKRTHYWQHTKTIP